MHTEMILLMLLASTAAAQTAQAKSSVTSSIVVFVCEHGSAKSVIAATCVSPCASGHYATIQSNGFDPTTRTLTSS